LCFIQKNRVKARSLQESDNEKEGSKKRLECILEFIPQNIDSHQNPSCFIELEHLKWQTTKLQHMLMINRMILCADVVIVIDFLGVNETLDV